MPPMTARAGSRRAPAVVAGLVPPAHEHADPDRHEDQRHQEAPPTEQVADGHPGPLAGRPERVAVEGDTAQHARR